MDDDGCFFHDDARKEGRNARGSGPQTSCKKRYNINGSCPQNNTKFNKYYLLKLFTKLV